MSKHTHTWMPWEELNSLSSRTSQTPSLDHVIGVVRSASWMFEHAHTRDAVTNDLFSECADTARSTTSILRSCWWRWQGGGPLRMKLEYAAWPPNKRAAVTHMNSHVGRYQDVLLPVNNRPRLALFISVLFPSPCSQTFVLMDGQCAGFSQSIHPSRVSVWERERTKGDERPPKSVFQQQCFIHTFVSFPMET